MKDRSLGRLWRMGLSVSLVVVAMTPMTSAEHQPEPATAIPSVPANTPDPRAAKEAQVRSGLTGTKWALELAPTGGNEQAKAHKDHVTFDERQVSSERLSKTGYGASNYTLTIGDDGVVVWETMQTKEGEGVAFWRGEFHGTTMRGVLSKHPLEGPTEDYSLSGQQVKGSFNATAAPGASQGVEASAEDSSKKKKKSKKSTKDNSN